MDGCMDTVVFTSIDRMWQKISVFSWVWGVNHDSYKVLWNQPTAICLSIFSGRIVWKHLHPPRNDLTTYKLCLLVFKPPCGDSVWHVRFSSTMKFMKSLTSFVEKDFGLVKARLKLLPANQQDTYTSEIWRMDTVPKIAMFEKESSFPHDHH